MKERRTHAWVALLLGLVWGGCVGTAGDVAEQVEDELGEGTAWLVAQQCGNGVACASGETCVQVCSRFSFCLKPCQQAADCLGTCCKEVPRGTGSVCVPEAWAGWACFGAARDGGVVRDGGAGPRRSMDGGTRP